MDAYAAMEADGRQHQGGAFPTSVLRDIERLLPARVATSAETGCGKSTVLLSNIAAHHTPFCLDDRGAVEGSVPFYERCPLTRLDRVHPVFGPTQTTLPRHVHPHPYDVVLIDGPHGWPFPEIEYWSLYPHVRRGGVLIVDDVNIPTIGRMADIIAEDAMWDLMDIVATTALFRRTGAATFDPLGDGWWTQRFNQRRVYAEHEAHHDDGGPRDLVTRRLRPVIKSTEGGVRL
jgi:hypothetical protein